MSSIDALQEKAHVFWTVDMESHVVALCWTPDRRMLIAGGIDGDVSIIDVAGGVVSHRVRAHAFGLASVSLAPDGSRFATCGQDGHVRIWSSVDASLLGECKLSDRWGVRAAYSPSGDFIAVAAGKYITLLDADATVVREFPALTSTVSDLAWMPRADRSGPETLASTAYGGVHLWRTDIDVRAKRFEWKGSSLVLAWSPDGKYIATGDQDSTVHFWIVARGKDLEMSGYPIKVKELAWSADSRFLATGGGDVVTVWDCSGRGPSGTDPLALEGHGNKIGALAYAKTGMLASGSDDGDVMIWTPASGSGSIAGFAAPAAITSLAWSGDDALLGVGTANGEIHCAAVVATE